MNAKFFTFFILFISVLVSSEKASAQQWLTSGNNLVGGETLGSLNSQPVNIVTNNISRIYVTPTGNVGIGTAAPIKGFTSNTFSQFGSNNAPVYPARTNFIGASGYTAIFESQD